MAELFDDDAVDAAGGRQRPRPALGAICASHWLRRDGSRCSPRPACSLPRRPAVPQHRQDAACTASTWATSWPRCSTCSAPFPGACGDDAAGRRRRRRQTDARVGACSARVLDPEVPALSVVDLGIVRDVSAAADGGLDVVLTPTYSGCPATEVIEHERRRSARPRRPRPGARHMQRAPAWTTDWISDEARRKLRDYGIAPPGPARSGARRRDPLRAARSRALACPRCGSTNTERLSAFGSHRLQGALPLPRLPRAVRTLQADLSAMSGLHFHPLRVRASSPDTDEARHRLLRRAGRRCASEFALHPGPVPDAAPATSTARTCAARTRSAPASTTASCASACARSPAACSRTGSTSACKPATRSQVMAPQGRFFVPLDAGAQRHYLGIAGGSGITPILSIMKTVLAREPHDALHADLRQPRSARRCSRKSSRT